MKILYHKAAVIARYLYYFTILKSCLTYYITVRTHGLYEYNYRPKEESCGNIKGCGFIPNCFISQKQIIRKRIIHEKVPILHKKER